MSTKRFFFLLYTSKLYKNTTLCTPPPRPPAPPSVKLGIERMSEILKPVWEDHFSKHNNERAWDKIGVHPFTRRVYWELKREEAIKKKHVNEVMNTDAAKAIAFPDGGGAAAEAVVNNDENDDAEHNDANDAGEVDGDGAPLGKPVSTRFSTGEVCFDGPVTKLSVRAKVKARTQLAKDKAAAAAAAAAAAREERAHKEFTEAVVMARALETRLSDPADPLTIEKLTIPQLKALLVFHNKPHKKSGEGTNKQYYLDLLRPFFE